MRSFMVVAGLVAASLMASGCATVSSCGDCGSGCGSGGNGILTGWFSNGCDTGCGGCETGGCTDGCETGGCSDAACGCRGRLLPRLGLRGSGRGIAADCNDCAVSSGPMNGVFGGAAACKDCAGGGCNDCQMGMAGMPGIGRMSLTRPALGCGRFGCGERGQLCMGCGLKGRFSGLRGQRMVADDCGCGDGCKDGSGCRTGILARMKARRAEAAVDCGCGSGCEDGTGCQVGGLLGRGGANAGAGIGSGALLSGRGAGARMGDGCGCGRGCRAGLGCRRGFHPYGGQIPHTAESPHMGGMAPQYAYPYYTTRGPRDFLQDNPMSIGR